MTKGKGEKPQTLESQLTQLRAAILTLTLWLAQTHVIGQQDVEQMEKILGLKEDDI